MDAQTTDRIALGISALESLDAFMPGRQRRTVLELILTSEERDFFIDKMVELAALAQQIPEIGQTDGQGDDAIVHLHYFGHGDWWVVEKSRTNDEAFGFANLGYPELGYIGMDEIRQSNVELDFHFQPTPLKEIKEDLGLQGYHVY